MALVESANAIGAVTEALADRLRAKTLLDITVGRPEPGAVFVQAKRLNLFLYEVELDGSLKNVPLDEGQPPPLWLVLKYLLTAFEDDGKTSDTVKAFEYLGLGIRALQELSALPVGAAPALSDNPETLSVTFDDAPTDLLSKVMQGSDEKYRVSIAFQVRPVMIATRETPSYSQLVGIDYTTAPVTTIGEAGIHIPVLPSMGPTITGITPSSFELGATVTVAGTDLHLAGLSVSLGPVVLPVTSQRPDQLRFVVREDIANGATISAGSHPLSVVQQLSTGRRRSSNLVVGNLLPTLITGVIAGGSLQTIANAPPPVGWKFATIDITGKLLGSINDDDSYLALFKDGATVKLFDVLADTSPAAAPQTERRLAMAARDAVAPGRYQLLYRVNGQQARQSAGVDLQ